MVQQGPAERMATERREEIARLLAKIEAEADRLAEDASWPATGSLGHIAEVLAELAGERS